MAALIASAKAYFARSIHAIGLVHAAMLMVRFTTAIIVLHLLQILLWAGYFRWKCVPNFESAFYFSTANYSTVGSGDLLLPHGWRSLGTLESIVGVLMCGLSVSFLFTLVMRLAQREGRPSSG
jgi:hypothetical protein